MGFTRRQLAGLAALPLWGCGDGRSGEQTNAAPSALSSTPAQSNYRVSFRNHWTEAAFPTGFPPSAHLTGMVGATHQAGVKFWAVGQAASQGIKDIAGVSLLQDGAWLDRLEAPLYVHDAGTDGGTTFAAADIFTAPPGAVQRLSTDATDSDLLDGLHRRSQAALASMLFERLT